MPAKHKYQAFLVDSLSDVQSVQAYVNLKLSFRLRLHGEADEGVKQRVSDNPDLFVRCALSFLDTSDIDKSIQQSLLEDGVRKVYSAALEHWQLLCKGTDAGVYLRDRRDQVDCLQSATSQEESQ